MTTVLVPRVFRCRRRARRRGALPTRLARVPGALTSTAAGTSESTGASVVPSLQDEGTGGVMRCVYGVGLLVCVLGCHDVTIASRDADAPAEAGPPVRETCPELIDEDLALHFDGRRQEVELVAVRAGFQTLTGVSLEAERGMTIGVQLFVPPEAIAPPRDFGGRDGASLILFPGDGAHRCIVAEDARIALREADAGRVRFDFTGVAAIARHGAAKRVCGTVVFDPDERTGL